MTIFFTEPGTDGMTVNCCRDVLYDRVIFNFFLFDGDCDMSILGIIYHSFTYGVINQKNAKYICFIKNYGNSLLGKIDFSFMKT